MFRRLRRPRYRVQIKQANLGSQGYLFYIWKGTQIEDTGYGFETAIAAAEAANAHRVDLYKAWDMTNS
jgi:hypothetical protein